MENILDVFNDDAFSVITLTQSLNNMPFIPGRAGTVIDWEEEGVITTVIGIESEDGTLRLVNPTPRGGPGTNFKKPGAELRFLKIPHYQIDDGVMADEVMGRRNFGVANSLLTVQQLVDKIMLQHARLKLDPTLEYQRIGAIKGIIINGNGTTLYNLYDEFGVAQPDTIYLDLLNASPESGALRMALTQVGRQMANNMQGMAFSRIHAFAGDEFFDRLIAHSEVRETYLNQAEAAQLREVSPYGTFNFGGVTWENYRGQVGNLKFIEDDAAYLFPVGAPGFWKTNYAPADYVETVNTPGIPRYARQWPMHNGKGVHMETQTNALNYPTRPSALLKVSLEADPG